MSQTRSICESISRKVTGRTLFNNRDIPSISIWHRYTNTLSGLKTFLSLTAVAQALLLLFYCQNAAKRCVTQTFLKVSSCRYNAIGRLQIHETKIRPASLKVYVNQALRPTKELEYWT